MVCVHGRIREWMGGQVRGWMGRQTREWMDEQTNATRMKTVSGLRKQGGDNAPEVGTVIMIKRGEAWP